MYFPLNTKFLYQVPVVKYAFPLYTIRISYIVYFNFIQFFYLHIDGYVLLLQLTIYHHWSGNVLAQYNKQPMMI